LPQKFLESAITPPGRIGGLEKCLIVFIVRFAPLSLTGSVGTINFIGIGFRRWESAIDQQILGIDEKTFTVSVWKRCHNRQTAFQITDFSGALRPQ